MDQTFERLLRKPKPPPPVVKLEDNNGTTSTANATTTDHNGTTTIPPPDAVGEEGVKVTPDAAASTATDADNDKASAGKTSKDEF